MRAQDGESFATKTIQQATHQTFIMKKVRNAFTPDRGWRTHPQFPGSFPTVIGWVPKSEAPNPRRTMCLDRATPQAVARWEAMKWPSNVAFLDDNLLMYPAVDGAFISAGDRVVSPNKTDTLLGFSAGYTQLPDASWSKLKLEPRGLEASLTRRNAIGNACALPDACVLNRQGPLRRAAHRAALAELE